MAKPDTEKPDWATRRFPGLFAYGNPDSLVNRFRRKRMHELRDLFDQVPSHGSKIRMLDIGGTCHFWQQAGIPDPERFEVVVLNLQREEITHPSFRHFTSVAGSALALPYPDKSFDIVFSNSVIEHVGSRENQSRMAREVMRVGRRYVIQTPGYWFPLEPHARIPFFQFAPRWLRALMIYHWDINYFPAGRTYKECLLVSDSTIMLTRREMRALFPGAKIKTERLLGLPKSYSALGGWMDPS